MQTQYPGLELVQGFTASITRYILNTTDADTPPGGIAYEMGNGPNNGYGVNIDQPDVPIESFSQFDVDKGKIMFMYDGSMESGAFYFKVTDGQFKPIYKVFNIKVHPLYLELENVTDIQILQGHPSVILSSENFLILLIHLLTSLSVFAFCVLSIGI